MKRLLFILLLFTGTYTFAQVKVNSEGDIIPTGIYPAVKSNNLKGTIHNFKSIADRDALPANFRDTGMIAYVTDSLKYYYLYNGITNADWRDLFNSASALTTGLTSTGDITLVDSTLTINDTIQYTIAGKDYTQVIPSVFTINSADSGYYRKDLIYADATGLHKLVGEQDTAFGVKPKLPINSIEITTVDIYGQQIVPPVPTIITPIPNLQQVTNEGNITTNPIFINSNSIQTPLRITSDFNRSNYLYFKNNSNGGWANTGFLFKNDVPDNPYDEWSGHWFRLMQGSTNSSMIKDGAIIMTNGTGGMKIVSDSGRITFNSGSPAYPYDPTSHPYKEMGAFETDGSFRLNNYKNNAQGDSVLSTDTQGKVVMKKVSVGDIDVLQNTIDSSSFGIKKLDGTVKNVVIYADGLTGIGGGGTQVNSDWNATSGVAAILNKPTLFSGSYTDLTNKPTIPAQFNPIAGTNMTITGTYPNLTFNSTASGGGSTYTASNGLTMSGSDVQLGGALTKYTVINGAFDFEFNGINSFRVSTPNLDIRTDAYTTTNFSINEAVHATSNMSSLAGVVTADNLSSLYSHLPTTPSTAVLMKTSNSVSNNASQIVVLDSTISLYTKANEVTNFNKFSLLSTGQLQINKYGSGTFTGTPTYNLGVDASGNVIEVATGGGGGGITQSQLDDTASAIRSSVKPYKVYSAMLSQTGTSAPTAYVLENTIGITPIFIYVQTGDYAIKFPSIAMPAAGKTAIITNLPNPNTPVIMLKAVYIDNKTVELLTKQASDGTPVDNALSAGGQTFIEIRVYN